jgi:hypothetical protein
MAMNQQAIPALTLLGLLMTVSACAGQEPPNPVEAGELPSEPTDVVVTVDHRPGGFGGPDDLMAEFVLRGDGRVIVGSDDAGEPFGETYRLTDAGVGEVRDLFARVARDQTAYGSVTVTDAGSTSLLLIAEPLAPCVPGALDLVLTPWLPGAGSVQPLPVTLATPLLDHPLRDGVQPGRVPSASAGGSQIGSRTVKVVPAGDVVKSMAPAWRVMMLRQMASPWPVPLPNGLVVKNWS